MKHRFVVVACLLLSNIVFGQVKVIKDSLGIVISKSETKEKDNELYDVIIINGRSIPVGIMHSVYINLFQDPPQRLGILSKGQSDDVFNLHYAAKDTMNDYENDNPNYNAEVVLPFQQIAFRLLIPSTHQQDRRLEIEYIALPDFCFNEFKQAIYQNAAAWYEKYKRNKVVVDLPNK